MLSWPEECTPLKLGAAALLSIQCNEPNDYCTTVQVLAVTLGVNISLATFQHGKWSFKTYLAGPKEPSADTNKVFLVQMDATFNDASVSTFFPVRQQLD